MTYWYYKTIYWRLQHYELHILRQFSAILVCSEQDASLLRELDETLEAYVMPNGVDLAYFHPQSTITTKKSLVFTGTFSYEPNVDAAVYFVEEILPLVREQYPEIELYLVGSNPHPRVKALAKDPRVIVTGYVDDVRPFVWDAAIVIVPLRMGSGTRLKVLEAMAMEKPLVSTSIGCEGISTVSDEHLLVANTPTEFAEAIGRLLREDGLPKALGRNGRRLVELQYSWEKTVLVLDDLFPASMENE
jgi:glycosyltransferase involved in cell wall biosynthesis